MTEVTESENHGSDDLVAANDRIREQTRRAVADFQRERNSDASSSERTAIGGDVRQDDEMEEPSDGRIARAGILGAIAPGQGGTAKEHLAGHNARRSAGWEEVTVPDKHRLTSPVIKTERTKALKVRLHLEALAGTKSSHERLFRFSV